MNRAERVDAVSIGDACVIAELVGEDAGVVAGSDDDFAVAED